jgi:23S rRNA (uridine2552-2'-O)-methyltransferase
MRKQDHYSKKAKQEGYAARSVYKLIEIQEKFQIIKKGCNVLDIGASPGSWSSYAAVKLKASVVAVDIKPLKQKTISGVHFIQSDIFHSGVEESLKSYAPFHAVISDAAPSTTGNRMVDTYCSLEIAYRVLDLSLLFLLPDGHIVLKIFQGGEERQLLLKMKEVFSNVRAFKPSACRSESFEIYLIGKHLKKT